MQDNIIIANNIALSRNINNYPFPHKLSQTESQNISQKINNIILECEDLSEDNFISHNIKDLSEIEKRALIKVDLPEPLLPIIKMEFPLLIFSSSTTTIASFVLFFALIIEQFLIFNTSSTIKTSYNTLLFFII